MAAVLTALCSSADRPTYRSGFKILVNRGANLAQGQNPWTVFAAFHYSVWIMLMATGVAVGLILWITDILHRCAVKAAAARVATQQQSALHE